MNIVPRVFIPSLLLLEAFSVVLDHGLSLHHVVRASLLFIPLVVAAGWMILVPVTIIYEDTGLRLFRPFRSISVGKKDILSMRSCRNGYGILIIKRSEQKYFYIRNSSDEWLEYEVASRAAKR